MKLEFKQAVHLKDVHGKGKDYPRGVHEVSQAVFDHPHSKQVLHKLAKAGLILEPKPEIAPASFYDRQKKLADKLAAQERSPAPVPPAPAAITPESSEEPKADNPPADDSSEPTDAEEPSDDQEDQPLSKNQQKKLKKQQKG